MADVSQQELLELINSKEFDISQCINLLRTYSNSIGVHHFLIQKLATYNYDEIEFYIPQFIQLLVTYETNSMALEDFLLNYSLKYPHFSLIVFWYLQAYIFELRNDPESYSFQTVRKFINQLQNIMFNPDLPLKKNHEFRENLHPAIVSMGSMLAAFAVPSSHQYSLPVIKSQSKQQKSFVFQLANFQKALTKNLTMKNLRLSSETIDDTSRQSTTLKSNRKSSNLSLPRNSQSFASASERNSLEDGTGSSDEDRYSLDSSIACNHSSKRLDEVEDSLKINTTIKSKKGIYGSTVFKNKSLDGGFLLQIDRKGLSQSLPDLRDANETTIRPYLSPTESETSLGISHSPSVHLSKQPHQSKDFQVNYDLQRRTLYVNYARKETDFIMALQNVSFRLSQIPKEARLSALRAELSMINETLLPSEIDIPQLFPLTSSKNKRYHKILKLNVNEACVLNSAERVPFLLLIEFLSDEFDFDPLNEHNRRIILRDSKHSSVDKPKVSNVLSNSQAFSSDHHSFPSKDFESFNDEADLGDRDSMLLRSGPSDLNKLKLLERKDEIMSDTPKTKPLEMPSRVLAGQMRIASVMLKQLEDSGKENSDQSVSIRNRIIESMISLQDQFDAINYEKLTQLKGDDPDAGERKLENDFKLGEDWATKRMRIRRSSIYGHLENWDLCSVIAKNGDDLPQEAFACQLIAIVSGIWKNAKIPAWTKKMKILITSANTGLVETINNAMSIHSIKKSLTELSISDGDNSRGRIFSLLDYFLKLFGPTTSANYRSAQENFARSLASYSILCYIFQIKDRHNGNIMVDSEGHIIHIDFGFILSNSPGSLGFEAAPFKLTTEYIELLGGQDSPYFTMFSDICKQCFKAVRKESDKIVDIVELMQKDSSLPCFNNGENTSVLLKQRLQLHLDNEQCDNFVENGLILKSIGSMYTRLYDQFQMVTQGIYS